MLSPILSCHDIGKTIEYFEKLGFQTNWVLEDDNHISFASISLFKAELLLGVIDFVDETKRDILGTGVQFYIELPKEMSIREFYQNSINNKVEIVKPLERRDWGETVFVMNDINGYNFMFAQQIKNID